MSSFKALLSKAKANEIETSIPKNRPFIIDQFSDLSSILTNMRIK